MTSASGCKSGRRFDGAKVSDLHVWQVGPGHRAAVISIVADNPQPPSVYKRHLAGLHNLSHVSVEVERCDRHGEATAA